MVEVAAEFWRKALRLRFPPKNERLLLDRYDGFTCYPYPYRLCVDGLTKLQTMNRNAFTFCVNGCRNVTKCGPIEIPKSHLNVNLSAGFIFVCSSSDAVLSLMDPTFSPANKGRGCQTRISCFTLQFYQRQSVKQVKY